MASRAGGLASPPTTALDPAAATRGGQPQAAPTHRDLPPATAIVKRSETEQAALDRLKTAQEAVADATRSFDERLKARSDALASRLGTAFAEKGIPVITTAVIPGPRSGTRNPRLGTPTCQDFRHLGWIPGSRLRRAPE